MATTRRSLSAAIEEALKPSPPGLLVTSLGSVLPGLARTRDQITNHNAYWRAEAEAALTGTERVLVGLGDSLTQGIGCSDPGDAYLGQLARTTGFDGRVVNLSQSGARIDDVLTTQLDALNDLDDRVAVVVCTIGSNDLMRSPRVSHLRRKFDVLADHLTSINATTVLATLPANGSMSAKYVNRHLRWLEAHDRVVLADVANHIETWRGRTASDGFHPNELGYHAWTSAFDAALERHQ